MHNILASDRALGLMFYSFALLVRSVYKQQCVHFLTPSRLSPQFNQGTVKI
jgi:hypothetical protein